MKQRAVGGWIKNAEFVGAGAYRRIEDFGAMNHDNIRYFEDYRTRYFFNRLVYGQGTENVLDMLQRYVGSPTSWMDLGASVTTLFWSLGFDVHNLSVIDVCDVVSEALYVLDSFKKTKEIPGCYMDAMHLMHKSNKDLDVLRKKTWGYHVFNCLGEWPIEFDNNRYELITNIGCFGISPDAGEYKKSFYNAALHLSPRGVFIGVDWVRSQMFVAEEGHDNTYLKSNLISNCGGACDLIKHHLESIDIKNDPYYDRMLIWVFQK